MERGQMRFEPNINLHITRNGRIYKTPIVEVKNLNSFRALESTVKYEFDRQYDEWLDDPEGFSQERSGKQNRGFDGGKTVFQREKEEAHDYRYFPDPDLVPLVFDDSWLQHIRNSLGELPSERAKRYREEFRLSEREIADLTQDRETGNLFDAAVSQGGHIKRTAHLIMGKAASVANQRSCSIADLTIPPSGLAELSNLLEEGKIVSTSASRIFDAMLDGNQSALDIASAENLLIERDLDSLNPLIDQVIRENPKAAEDFRKEGKAIGFLIGQVMKKTGGTAPPQDVRRILLEKLDPKTR